jgi:predicted O-methyltransferase YrrM
MSELELHDAEHFRQFVWHEHDILLELEKEAVEKDIPIVGPLVGKMLWFHTKLMNARSVLELGTATGYSAIWIAMALKETGGKLTSIEWDSETAEKARSNIANAGLSEYVEVLNGDANEMLSNFEPDTFDLIFQDIEKEMYLDLLEPCTRILRSGGLLFFDNTAFKTAGEFLQRSLEHTQLEGYHLFAFLPEHSPDWDGLTFLIKQ